MNRTRRFILAAAGSLLAGGAWAAREKKTLNALEYQRRLGAALDEVAARIPQAARRRIEFSVNLFLAHEVWVAAVPTEILQKSVDALKELGVDRVDMNLGLFPWLEQERSVMARYDATVDRIRSHGLKLILNPQYSAAKHKMASFDEWQGRAIKLYGELARRYRPHTFVVSHEPTTMSKRLGSRARARDWVNFTAEAAREVKRNSPETRIGAGGLSDEREYFDAFAAMPETEVLTVDIYGVNDLRVYNRMTQTAHAARKPIYIEETWRPPFYAPSAGMTLESVSMQNIGNREFEALDGRWLQVMTAYAQALRHEAITPFWMPALFSYVDGPGDMTDPAYNRAVIEAIARGERTETFRTMQTLIRENQKLPA